MPDIVENSCVCLICDSHLSVSTSSNIFSTSMPRNGDLLANFVIKILPSSAAVLHGSQMCRRCYDLFETLEQAEWTANETKSEIFRVYESKNCESIEKIDTFTICDNVNKFETHVPTTNFPELRTLDVILRVDDTLNVGETLIENFVEANSRIDDDYEIERLKSESKEFVGDQEISHSKTKFAGETVEKKVFGLERKQETTKNLIEKSSQLEFDNENEKDENLSISRCPEISEKMKQNFGEIGTWRSGRISKYSQKPLKYSCTSCEKKWRTSAELRTHAKSHSSLRPYMCEKCGQSYKHKNALEIHVGMHNGVSPFRCNVCEKIFTQKGALMRHLPMHTGETPYQCELCGKRFVHHTSYNMHALSHTGKKLYRCHVCDLSLLSTSHLKRHMRVHTGEKPYSCSLCGKSFAERYNLFAHQKIHDPAEIMAKAAKKMPYKCETCDEHFDKKQKLEEHAIEHDKNITMNQIKWIGHTIDVNSSINVDNSRIRQNNEIAERSWRNYEKFTNSSMEMRTEPVDNQISQETINILMSQDNYNRPVIIQSTNTGNMMEINRTQM